MTENQRPHSWLGRDSRDPWSLSSMIDATLKRGSGVSISLSGATIGVNLDKRGDWTITVGLRSKSGGFDLMASALEGLGFFQAAENEGSVYMIWTSLLSETSDGRVTTEQTLLGALKILQAATVSSYVG